MDTSNLTFKNIEGHIFHSQVLWPFIYFLSRICILTMHQRWISDIAFTPSLTALAAPDDSMLELAPPALSV